MKTSKKLCIKSLIITTLLSCSLFSLYSHYKFSKLEEFLSLYDKVLSEKINETLSPLNFLSSIQSSLNRDITQEEFSSISQALFDKNNFGAFVAISNDAIKYVYPLEHSSEMVGLNSFKYESFSKAADFSIIEDELFFSGPFEFTIKDKVILAFKPVYVYNEKGIRDFWGFYSASIKIAQLIKDTELFSHNAFPFYQYSLSLKIDTKNLLLEKSQSYNSYFSVEKTIPFNNMELNLSLSYTIPEFINIQASLLIFITLFILFFSLLYSLLPYNKRFLFTSQKKYTDILTNANTTRKLLDYIKTNDERIQTPFTLININIYGFKNINESYGNSVGDNLLIAFVERIKSKVKIPHFIVRLGADRFILVFENVYSVDRILEIEFLLLKLSREKFEFDGNVININTRLSHAIYPHDGRNFTELYALLQKRLPYEE